MNHILIVQGIRPLIQNLNMPFRNIEIGEK